MNKGLLTNSELADSIIADVNNLIKEMVSGQYVQCCYAVTVIVQKLLNLKKGIENINKTRGLSTTNLETPFKH